MVLCSSNIAGAGLSGTISVEVDAQGRAVLTICNTSTAVPLPASVGFVCFDVLNQVGSTISVVPFPASTISATINRNANCGGGTPPAPGSDCDQFFEVRLNLSGGDGAGGGIAQPVFPATENCRIITLQSTTPVYGSRFLYAKHWNTLCGYNKYSLCRWRV